jgi:hypothetical protein
MSRRRTYCYRDAYRLLRESEGRQSPKSGEPGHTIELHVGGREAQVGGRLRLQLAGKTIYAMDDQGRIAEKIYRPGTLAAPILIGPGGVVASRGDSIEMYVEAGRYPSKNQARQAYDRVFTAPRSAAGAFLDQQQTARALQFALNTLEGQDALSALDSGSPRECFAVAIAGWTIAGRADARKMYFAATSSGPGDDSDLTHLRDFSRVFVGIDALSTDAVHLQTFYPIA